MRDVWLQPGRASRANKKSQRSRVSQYIPRVSRRRITGMSNTIHTFMHALQVRWRVKLGCSLAFANPMLPPGASPRKPWMAPSPRVWRVERNITGREAVKRWAAKYPEASREQRSEYHVKTLGESSGRAVKWSYIGLPMVALFTLRLQGGSCARSRVK